MVIVSGLIGIAEIIFGIIYLLGSRGTPVEIIAGVSFIVSGLIYFYIAYLDATKVSYGKHHDDMEALFKRLKNAEAEIEDLKNQLNIKKTRKNKKEETVKLTKNHQ